MGEPRQPVPVMLVVAAFSRHPEVLAWATQRLEERFGTVALASTPFAFNQTAYYQPTMGAELQKQFMAFRELIAPDWLAEIKLATNKLEQEIGSTNSWPEPRPLNLDPGILTLGKFHLATTKDQAHRVYLRDGIFAEVTLRYESGAFVPWPWTYADYRLPEVLAFMKEAREYYHRQLQQRSA
ncbi:hypothetical protein AYO44_00785 [Planctomycetaceae bacterium SCGC AG-212-F19]|nr:hypothetical protein AYO44_00785 [Planctomycetaceae bacterium SCGC AG-212-F19]